jgi:metal-responsive CopG/Arc/MetJ family transcriptional regulator
MNRTQIYLTEKQMDFLKKVSLEDDISMSELIRRIIDSYIKEQKNENK